MGACLSSSSGAEIAIIGDLIQSATAKVVTVDGHLLEYSGAVKAYEVLGRSHPFCFLCSSDDLDRDAPIPPLGSQDSLERGQLYFMLPLGTLRGPLRGPDMAALAVRASLALADAAPKRMAREPGVVARVLLPTAEADGGVATEDDDVFEGSNRFHATATATGAKHSEGEKMIRRKETGRGKFMGRAHALQLQSKVGRHPGTC